MCIEKALKYIKYIDSGDVISTNFIWRNRVKMYLCVLLLFLYPKITIFLIFKGVKQIIWQKN